MRFHTTQPRNHPAVVKADLPATQCRAMHDAARNEPGDNADQVEVMQGLDFEPGNRERSSKSVSGVPPVVIERTIQGPIDCGDSWNEKEEHSSRNERFVGGAQEFSVALDVLEHVHRDHRVGAVWAGNVFEIPVMNANASVGLKPLMQMRDVVSCGLDEQQPVGRGVLQHQIGHRAYARAGFYDPLAKRLGEGIDNPAVIVRGFRNRVELGSGI